MPAIPSPDATAPETLVALNAAAHERLVARVGSFAASVFVGVALSARPDERGVLIARPSARMLARQLGVAKDTAAGALRILGERGYMRRLVQPRSGGRFAPARYVVRLPDGFVVWSATGGVATPRPCPAPAAAVPRPARPPAPRAPEQASGSRRARRKGPSGAGQLGLFGPVSQITDARGPR